MGIRVSEKHGVNPSINVCFFCGADKNEIVLPGRLKGDAEAPHRAVWNQEPCESCRALMERGVMISVVKDGSNRENPYRTGHIIVVKDKAAAEIFNIDPEKTKFLFLEESAARKVFGNKLGVEA